LPPAVEGINVVIHTAAFFRSFTDNEGIIKTNHAGTAALPHTAIAAGVIRFVFTSTGNVYGADYQRPAKEDDAMYVNDPRAYSSWSANLLIHILDGLSHC
jgi:nucleoside-diphosphate-sugar epimerase